MAREFIAHINDNTKEIQTVKEHSENTAELCREFAIPVLKDVAYAVGLLHDCGKYQTSFQRHIMGNRMQVEHSVCGALIAKEKYAHAPALALMIDYCITGHHSGIPDGGYPNDTQDLPTLYGRMSRTFEDYSAYEEEIPVPEIDVNRFQSFLLQDCSKNMELFVDKYAFLTRYIFSCLTDADSLDTAGFCGLTMPRKLLADFQVCLDRVEKRLNSFVGETMLQKSRALVQGQVFEKESMDAEIYLMNMPTGSGKTLCSTKFALQRAVKGKKKRIIYIIPYNSIIDQTADVLEHLFVDAAEILRHQSNISYEDNEDYEEDFRIAAKSASENWDAPLIITTAVQFFESIYSNKRGKLRKLHNMADSILIFDEAHLMPKDYLQPCLRAITYITHYLNSEAIFLTATMPDYARLINLYALPECRVANLVEDTSLFDNFAKCRFEYLGEMGYESVLEKAQEFPSNLLVVNKRSTARKLYQDAKGRKYHLSTYMTAYDRRRIISEIKQELDCLEKDFPDYKNVPAERRVTIISTSLIEAGVDLDVHTVFRELAGLDNILQAGGRCNREGKRKEATTYIFELQDGKSLERYDDISSTESIKEFYDKVFFLEDNVIQRNTITKDSQNIFSIPFRQYAEQFEIIDSKQISIVVPRDDKSRELMEKLRYAKGGVIRQLQIYTCSVYLWELEDLRKQHVVDDFGTGVWCLLNEDYYDKDVGMMFEAKDYYI